MNLETFGQVVGRFHKHLDKCGRKAGESWRKLGKAGGSNICAFRSPARSGLIPSWGSWKPMLASWALLGPLFLLLGRICVRSGVLMQFFGF